MERNSFMDATSPKDERFETLKQLYPELIRDNKLNLEALKDLFDEESFDEGEVGYNLYWPGKRDAKKLARKEAEGTLEPVIGDGVNEDKTSNIYIEGDNLEVLRCLKKSYGGRVKMIYIDPPYNTGKDFIYPDNFAEPVEDYLKFTGQVDEKGGTLVANPKSSGAYHRRWLDMMLPRLHLARELLANDGVIFISIDDNEQANLKLLCDEVFGEENLITQMVVNRPSEVATSLTIQKHEYCFVYARNSESKNIINKKVNAKYSLSRGTVGNENQTMPEITFPAGLRCESIPDGVYESTRQKQNSRENIENKSKIIVENGRLREPIVLKARWRSSQDMRNFFNNGCNPTPAKINGIIEEIFFKDDTFNPQIKKLTTEKFSSLYLDNKRGSESLEKLGMGELFDFPKSPYFIKDLIKLVVSDGDIVLDFFSGSGTTAQALFLSNYENKTKSKFVLAQLNVPLGKNTESKSEKAAIEFLDSIRKPHTICEISKERIRRAGKKILEEHPELKDELDVGFKVYRLAKSNISSYKPTAGSDQQSLLSALDAMEKQVTPLRDGFDMNNQNDVQGLLVEIILRQGFALDSNIEKATSLAGNTIYRIVDKGRPIVLHVCLDEKIKAETVKNIAFEEDDKFICLNKAITDELYAQLSDKGRVETI